jgi:16S rRNA (uracil1498-N3)-methyltransferase
VERDDLAPVASFYVDDPLRPGTFVALGESAAHHARVKRLEAGDHVRVTNGRGTVAAGAITTLGKRDANVEIGEVRTIAAPWPLHVCVPIADKERMLWLAEKATELGITSWQPVRFRRSASVSPRGEGAAFEAKTLARMIGALEQSGGAWLPSLLPETTVDHLSPVRRETSILLDVDGAPLASVLASSGDREVGLLFGPEGGLDANERAQLVAGGWQPARLTTTTLRFETAGIAAIAVGRNVHQVTES